MSSSPLLPSPFRAPASSSSLAPAPSPPPASAAVIKEVVDGVFLFAKNQRAAPAAGLLVADEQALGPVVRANLGGVFGAESQERLVQLLQLEARCRSLLRDADA